MPKKREVIGVQEVFLHESKNENGTLLSSATVFAFTVLSSTVVFAAPSTDSNNIEDSVWSYRAGQM